MQISLCLQLINHFCFVSSTQIIIQLHRLFLFSISNRKQKLLLGFTEKNVRVIDSRCKKSWPYPFMVSMDITNIKIWKERVHYMRKAHTFIFKISNSNNINVSCVCVGNKEKHTFFTLFYYSLAWQGFSFIYLFQYYHKHHKHTHTTFKQTEKTSMITTKTGNNLEFFLLLGLDKKFQVRFFFLFHRLIFVAFKYKLTNINPVA